MLVNISPTVLPDTSSDEELCNEFEQFFVSKIHNIMKDVLQLNSTLLENDLEPLCNSGNLHINAFDRFHSVTSDFLKTVMSELSNKQCELDVMPTELFK